MLKKCYLFISSLLFLHATSWANDDCSNATPITPNTTCSTITGTFNGMTVSNPVTSCGVNASQDVWYVFTATDAINRIQVAPSGVNVGFEIYENSCSGTLVTCVNTSTGTTTTEAYTGNQFTIGNTYYIRVFNANTSLSTANFTICVINYPAPANDLCANATVLTPNTTCSNVAGTMSGALLDGGPLTCATTASQDVWYQFTATDSTMRVTVSPTSFNVGFEIKENSCAGSSMICIDNNSSGSSETYFANHFKPGTTYFVRVFNTSTVISANNFNICVERFETPINDECSNAITLNPELTCLPVTGTFSGAMFNGGAPISCGTTAVQDVWYKFTATDTTMSVILGATSGLNHGFQIIENACNGSIVNCTNAGSTSIEERYLNNTFSPGKTYYIRVFNNGNLSVSNFTICVQKLPRPANDECANATVITPSTGTCTNVPGTFNGALNSVGPNPLCGATTTQDVWYQFTAIDSTVSINLPNASGINHGFEILENGCGGTSIQCINASTSSTESFFGNRFKPGTNYAIRVFNNGPLRTENFNICVQTYPSPSNDICANATTITPTTGGCTNIAGTFSGAMYETSSALSCATTISQDVWYKFTATDSTTRINLANSSGLNHGFRIIEGSCSGTTFQCINNSTSSTESYLGTTFNPGTTYYIQVFNNTTIATNNFNICVETYPSPTNDNCANAATLTPTTTCINTAGTFSGSLLENSTPPSCASLITQDVWYKFTATDSMMRVSLSSTSSSINQGFEILESSCTGNVVSCINNTSSSKSITSTNFAPNTTYYVRVFNVNNIVSNTFNICVINFPAPANDACANATPLTVNTTCSNTQGTFSGAKIGNDPAPTCGNNASQDVWFSFVATNTSHTVTLGAVSGLDHGYQIFENSCSGNAIFCRNNNSSSSSESTSVTGLTIGATYYVRVFNASPTLSTSNFNICVYGAAASTCTPTISINSSSSTICSGTSVTFTSSVTNAGSSPTYQWKINGVNAGTNSATFTTTALNNGDIVTCTLTSNETCAASNPTVNSNAITITTTTTITPSFSSIGAICAGDHFTLPTTSTNGIIGTWSPAVDNQATTTYTFTPAAGQCASSTTMTVTVNATLTTPTFTQINPICAGDHFSLPTTSTNGITGTWSPAVDNQATTTYTFTPAAGQCASSTTMTVTVNTTLTTPTFTQINPICAGDHFTLLTTSTNGITGTWSPAVDNQATTTYTFTPSAGQCASTTTMTVTVNATLTTPTFTQINPICAGDHFTLPTTSTNGIIGTWSPAVNNQATTTYTFTPSAGQCASTTTMTVTVNATLTTPTFDPIAPLCKGAAITLPTSSTNGINGLWSPIFNPSQTTTYTFIPQAGQCASITTLTVQITEVNTDLVILDNTIAASFRNNANYQWINCDDHTEISAATNSSFTPSQNGTYAVVITENQCSDTSECVTIQSIGVDEVDSKNNVIIFPNPVENNFTIVSSSFDQHAPFFISDITGRMVMEGVIQDTHQTVSIPDLPAGLYFLQLSTRNEVIKIIKR